MSHPSSRAAVTARPGRRAVVGRPGPPKGWAATRQALS